MSSVDCTRQGHPIEIQIRTSRPAGLTKYSIQLTAEVQKLASALSVEWGCGTFTGRGPSLPELAAKDAPSSVDLRALYLGHYFDDAARSSLAVRPVRWPLGWYFNTLQQFTKAWQEEPPTYRARAWQLLRGWRATRQ